MPNPEVELVLINWINRALTESSTLVDNITPATWVAKNFQLGGENRSLTQ